jgi:hypothetical protein
MGTFLQAQDRLQVHMPCGNTRSNKTKPAEGHYSKQVLDWPGTIGNQATQHALKAEPEAGVARSATGHFSRGYDQYAVGHASASLTSRWLPAIARQDLDPDSPTGAAETPARAETEPVPLGPPPTNVPAKAPTPVFDHSGGQTVTINADSAPDFARNITAAIGSPHTSAAFTPDIAVDFKTDAAGKQVPGSQTITSIGLTVNTAITKVRFGMGRPNAEHKKAINEMVVAIQDHEGKHRAIIETEATSALAGAQKFVGTGKTTEANTALTTTLECATNKKHEALDASEGLLTAVEQSNGTVVVTKSASGATYPCPKAQP